MLRLGGRLNLARLLIALLVVAVAGNYFGVLVLVGVIATPLEPLTAAWLILVPPKILFLVFFGVWLIRRMRPKVAPSGK